MKRRAGKRLIGVMTTGFVLLILILITIGMLQDSSEDKRTYKIIMVPKTIDESNDFWPGLIEGAKLGAEEFGCEIEVIKESIKKNPDAFLIAPCSYTHTTEAVQEAINAGIKVILVDSVIDKEIANGVVATDNFKAGKELGTFAKTILKPDSKIGVVAHVKGSSTATERENGIREGLGEDQDRIQDIVYCSSSYDLASDLTENMLRERPDIDIVIGTNEYSAVGAARGVRKAGMEGQVKIVGFDNSVEQIQLLEAGVFQGIVIQKPFNIGYLGVEQAVKAIEGYPMEYNLDSGCKLITKENMYEEENQRLLYPFSGQQ